MLTWFRRLLIPTIALALIFSASAEFATAADKAPAKDAKKEDPKKEEPAKGKDPKDMNADEAEDAGLCPVTKKQSKPVYHYEYKGRDYHFNTREAQKQFAAGPEKFGAKGAEAIKK
jgi:YHS domain-containing protein